jgi:hypothetical protein
MYKPFNQKQMKKEKMRRPTGLTLMSINLRQNINKEEYRKQYKVYIRYVLQQYISQGYRLNETPYSIQDLSYSLGISVNEVIKEIGRVSNLWFNVRDKDRVGDGLGMMVMKLMEATIRDRAEIEDNLRGLKSELVGPGGKKVGYKAFLSAEINRALSLNLASHKSMADTANLLMKLSGLEGPKAQPTINITQTNEANLTNQNYLTPESAIALLAESKNQMIAIEGQVEALEAEYITDEVPDVNPLTQVGFGIDNSSTNLKTRDKGLGHEDRREGKGEILS